MSNTGRSNQQTLDEQVKNTLRQQQDRLMYDLSDAAFDAAKVGGDTDRLKQVASIRKKSSSFDHLVATHFSGQLKEGTANIADSKETPPYRATPIMGWISELKIRYLTNANLDELKVDAILRLIRTFDGLSTVSMTGKLASQAIFNTSARLKIIIDIQVSTRRDEAIIELQLAEMAQKYSQQNSKVVAKIARQNIEATADFIRDIHTLVSLGFAAPQLHNMLDIYRQHPNLSGDAALLSRYRDALESALLTFYWDDPRYFLQFTSRKNTILAPVGAVALKGAAAIPVENPSIRSSDDRARDYNIGVFPTELIPVLSKFVRDIVYDLTRKKAPSIRNEGKRSPNLGASRDTSTIRKITTLLFTKTRDPNRITRAQERELARLRDR